MIGSLAEIYLGVWRNFVWEFGGYLFRSLTDISSNIVDVIASIYSIGKEMLGQFSDDMASVEFALRLN